MEIRRDPSTNVPLKRPLLQRSQGTQTLRKPMEFNRGRTQTVAPQFQSQQPRRIAGFLDAVVTISLAAIFFGVPLFFTARTFQGIVFEKYMYFFFFLLIALVAWVAKGVLLGTISVRRTPLDIPLFGFWVLLGISTFFSMDKWHSFFGSFGDLSRGLLGVSASIVFFYILASHFTMTRLKWFMGSLVVSGCIVIIHTALVISNILPAFLSSRVPLSLFGTITSLVLYLSLLLPILMGILLKVTHSSGMRTRGIVIPALLFFIVADIALLFVLSGFVGWVALFGGVGFFLVFVLGRVVRIAKEWSFVPMVVFASVLIAFMVFKQFPMLNIPTQLPLEVSPSIQLSNQIAWGGIKDHPLLGSGIGTYASVFSQFRPQNFNTDQFFSLRFSQPSGMVSEMFATIGVIPALVFMLTILTFVSVGIYMLSREHEKNKILSLGVWSSSIMFVIALFVSPVNGSLFLVGSAIASLALVVVMEESYSEKHSLYSFSLTMSPKYALSMAFLFIVISAGVVFLFVSAARVMVADTYAGSAVRAKEVNESDSVSRLLKAISIYPAEGHYYVRVGQEYMVLANQEAIKKQEGKEAVDNQKIRQYLENATQAVLRGRDLLPGNVAAQEAVAQIYDAASLFVADAPKKAEEEYGKAAKLEPSSPIHPFKIGQMKLAQARSKEKPEEKKPLIEEAKGLFQKSIELKPDFSEGFYYLSITKEALDDISAAIDDMLKAVSYDRNPDYLFQLARLYQTRSQGSDADNARQIYEALLSANPKNIYVQLNLALLYDKEKNKDKSLESYQKVLDMLPSEGSEEIRSKIESMMDNVRKGIFNEQEKATQASEVSAQPTNQEPPTEGTHSNP